MGLLKCPRCELNYILDDGQLCTVCREEVRGKRAVDDAVVLCSVCGELPALPGEDMCKGCLAEIRFVEALPGDEEEEAPAEPELSPEPVSELDEIEPGDGIEDEGEDADETDEDTEYVDALDA